MIKDDLQKQVCKWQLPKLTSLDAKITNQNARNFLEDNLFPDLRNALKDLLSHIQTSGELTKYWSAVDKQNADARKAAKKVERCRRRIWMGSEYESSEGEREELAEELDIQRKEDAEFEEYVDLSSEAINA